MQIRIIPTEEFPPNQVFGDFNLFDHCAVDETPKHKYQFKISLTRAEIAKLSGEFLENPKNTEPLEEYNARTGFEFCYHAFLKDYSYDTRGNFLEFQFSRTPAKQMFLDRVQNYLSGYDWDCLGEKFCYSAIKEREVIRWLDSKIEMMNKGLIKHSISHRHHALIYYYLTEARYLPKQFRRKEIIDKFGKARERAIDLIWNDQRRRKNPPTKEELETILPFLRIYSNAYKLVENTIDQL